jgi:hypothetical protein
METAISRLRALPEWNRWITFCAQGEGSEPDTYHVAEVRLLGEVLEIGNQVDIPGITSAAKVPIRVLTKIEGRRYSIGGSTPREAAQLLDALFRDVLGIRPFLDEDDYAVGVEW